MQIVENFVSIAYLVEDRVTSIFDTSNLRGKISYLSLGFLQVPDRIVRTAVLIPEQVRSTEFVQFLKRATGLGQYDILMILLSELIELSFDRTQIALKFTEDALGLLDLLSKRLFFCSVF